MKTIIMLKTKCLLTLQQKERIREDFKKGIEEGLLIVDGMFEWPELINIMDDQEYDVVVQEIEENTNENRGKDLYLF